MNVNPRNEKWHCSKCDYLCTLLTPSDSAAPNSCPIFVGRDTKWFTERDLQADIDQDINESDAMAEALAESIAEDNARADQERADAERNAEAMQAEYEAEMAQR